MPSYSFVKKTGAPAGTINFVLAEGLYLIDDTTHTPLITSNADAAKELAISPYLTLSGVSGTYVPPLSPFQQELLEWVVAESFFLTSATRNSNGAVTTASVLWPDGQTGTLTTDVFASGQALGAIDAYHITYVPTTGPTMTITQAAVTRDSSGGVVAQPLPTFS